MVLIRIVILDEHQIVAEGLRLAFDNEMDMEVVKVLSSIEHLQSYAAHADIIITELKIGGTSVLPVIEKVAEIYPDKHFVVLTAYKMQHYHGDAMFNNIMAALPKTISIEHLIDILRKIFYLNKRFCPKTQKGVLTDREQEILSLIACDMTNKEISEALYISRRTVDYQISSLIRKLEVESRVGAVIKGIKLGIVETELI